RAGVHAQPRVDPLPARVVRRARAGSQGQSPQARGPQSRPGRPARARRRRGRPGRGRGRALAGHGARDRANDPRRPLRSGVLDHHSVERSLGLICGAGVLPARMAGEARRHGWRVVAFTFGEAPGLADHADLTIPSRISEAGVVLATLQAEQVGAVVFSGKFWMTDLLRERPDATLAGMKAQAGSMTESNIVQVVVATLGRMGIELLDQRPFLGDWIGPSGCWSSRAPTDTEREDIRRGLAVARLVADAGVGQVVVVRQGVVTAVEATEGTTETIRRGLAQAG